MPQSDIRYLLATTMLTGVGPILARQLIAYFGSAEAIFHETSKTLQKIPGIGPQLSKTISDKTVLAKADEELEKALKQNITVCCITDSTYPERLKHCEDAPLLFFYKGNCNFNHHNIICIVGTRNATEYGKHICEQIVHDLAPFNPIIVSGLAFGIDICAHKAALKEGLQTIAVIGAPLQKIHPSSHIPFAQKIAQQGAILSEYHSNTQYENSLFVKRNRIIAGMSDACILIESKTKGGALLTADFSHQYNREVFAIPGNVGAPYSSGCNMLIKEHKAILAEQASDIITNLNWDISTQTKNTQKQLFINLLPDEEIIYSILRKQKECTIDSIAKTSGFTMSKTSSILLGLEFKELIRALPGKRFIVT